MCSVVLSVCVCVGGGEGGGVLAMSQAQALCRVWYLTLYNVLMRVCVCICLAGYPLHRENRENGPKIPCQRKHREFGNFAKTQGKHREFRSICKFPDSNGKRYFDIRPENFQICCKAEYVYQVSLVYVMFVCLWD